MANAPAATPAPTPAPRSQKMRLVTLVAVIAIVEGALFFALAKFLGGGPQASHGAEQHVIEGPDPHTQTATVEVPLLSKFRVPNSVEGRTWIYELDLIVQVPSHRREEFERLKTDRTGAISDAVASIVRSLEPRELNEPDLRTLRMRIQRVLTDVAEDQELIRAIWIPRCVPMRAG
jgi:hypothetical protein